MPKNDIRNDEFLEYDVVLLKWEITEIGKGAAVILISIAR